MADAKDVLFFSPFCVIVNERMSVRALCDTACRLGMDADTARTLALYEGVLAADPAAQPVLAWAQAVADELQTRTAAAAAALSSSSSSSGAAGAPDDGLWPRDDAAEIARIVAQTAEVDRRRHVVEALTARACGAAVPAEGLEAATNEDDDDDGGELATAAAECVAACELLQQVLRDVAATPAPAPAEDEDAAAALAEYLAAETAALDAARGALQRALDASAGTSSAAGALAEVERDAWLLQRAFTAGEVALLDAHVSRAEALSADPACPCPGAGDDDAGAAEAALQRLSEATLPRVLAAAQRAETLPLLLADSARRRAALAAQGRAVARAADVLAAACARVVLLAALCASDEHHARARAAVLAHAHTAAADAAAALAAPAAACAQVAGASDASAASFVRAAAALCTAAAHRTGTELAPTPAAAAASPTVDDVAAWLACLRRAEQSQSPLQPQSLAPLLRRAGVALPLVEGSSGGTSGNTSGGGDEGGTTGQLEALRAMARELAVQVHSLRAQVTGVLAREQHDAHYRTQRTLWECFLHEPDRLLALVPPPD